jgi:16S rRNA (guanine966-N2)-methyltransferase
VAVVTRIIAGSARGRRISVPAGRETRPTADRVREGLFSTLESLLGSFAKVRFLDLYAGSGAVGLEALSRGAARAVLVESNPATARLITANADALGLAEADVRLLHTERFVRRAPPGGPFDVVFADPPYALPDAHLRAVLVDAHVRGWFTDGAVVAVERPTRGSEWSWPEGVGGDRFRRYGEATLWYGRATPQNVKPSPAGFEARAEISEDTEPAPHEVDPEPNEE